MDEQGNAQLRRPCQHGTQVGMVEMALARAATEQRALEAELSDGAFQLAGSGLGIGSGQSGEALKAVGAACARLGNEIIHATSRLNCVARRKIVQAGRGEGEHLHVHALLIHQRQTALAQVGQAGPGLAAVGNGRHGIMRGRRGRPCLAHLGWEDVLFDCDQAQ